MSAVVSSSYDVSVGNLIDESRLVWAAPTSEGAACTVDLWWVFYEGLMGEARQRAILALLCDAERARHDALCYERDRVLYLATRALVRTVLSQYAEVAPAEWRFG